MDKCENVSDFDDVRVRVSVTKSVKMSDFGCESLCAYVKVNATMLRVRDSVCK